MLAWILIGLESTIRGGEMHYREAFWFVPWVLTMIAFAAAYSAQRPALTRAGRIAAQTVGVTMVLVLLGNVGVVVGSEELAMLGFPLGVALWMAAMISFGVATIRARVLPLRVGLALILFEPLSILTAVVLAPIAGLYESGNYSGGIGKGIVLGVILLALIGLLRGNDADHASGTGTFKESGVSS